MWVSQLIITVASYRRKIWLLYFFLATLLFYWTLHVKVKLAICNQSKVSHSKEFSICFSLPSSFPSSGTSSRY